MNYVLGGTPPQILKMWKFFQSLIDLQGSLFCGSMFVHRVQLHLLI